MLPTNRITSSIFDHDGINHGFFTRRGGMSQGVFDSLNCSPYSDDLMDSINENRRRIIQSLGAESMCSLRQVHGSQVYTIDDKASRINGLEGDGLVCNVTGVCIGVLTADCAPILFCDAKARVIGVAHAGWQGALNGVLESVLENMGQLGSCASDVKCAIGPLIASASYEVGPEFMSSFIQQSPIDCEEFFEINPSSGREHFDLGAYVEKRLRMASVKQIDRLQYDTYKDDSFFSFRQNCHLAIQEDKNKETYEANKYRGKGGEILYGRQISAITLG